jgi:hypothetical protein
VKFDLHYDWEIRMQKPILSSDRLPLFLVGGGVIIIMAILIWLFVAQSASSIPTQSANSNIPYSNIQRTALTDARTALANKTAVFVDVRDLDVYNTSHISGAMNIPLADFETRYRELDPNKWIITYCT